MCFILAFDEYNISPFQCHNSVKLQLIYMSILYSMLEQPVEQFIVMYMLVRHYTVHRSYGNWIYNYLFNQCLSPLMLWVRISIRARCTTLCDKVCQRLSTGQWFSTGPPISSTDKTDRHGITEILLKVAFYTIKQTDIYLQYSECKSPCMTSQYKHGHNEKCHWASDHDKHVHFWKIYFPWLDKNVSFWLVDAPIVQNPCYRLVVT
jgi:hypothetical protein